MRQQVCVTRPIQTDFGRCESANDVGEVRVSGGVGRVERVLHQLVSKCFVGAAKQQNSRAFLLQTTTHVDSLLEGGEQVS